MIFPKIPKVEVAEHLKNFKSTENMLHFLGIKDVDVSALHIFLEKNPSLREYLQKKRDSEINKKNSGSY